MIHRHVYDALDITLKDILLTIDQHAEEKKTFGGLTVVLGGDFRQILPVVYKRRRKQVADASLINAGF